MVLIVDGARTPIGRFGGGLSGLRPDDLAAHVIRACLDRTGIPDEDVSEVVLGCANQAGEDNRNVARMAVLLAGLPVAVPAMTVNRLCASGLSAVVTARQMIESGDADVVIAGGVESMSRAPWVMGRPDRAFAKPGPVFDTSIGWRFVNPSFSSEITASMPQTAETVAARWGITREQMDEFAALSHQRAVAARDGGRLGREIVPVGGVEVDEGPRADTSAAVLAGLRPIHGAGGVVTAGNASSLNDGAAAVVLVSESYAEAHGLRARARILAAANAGVAPDVMGIGPVPATRAALGRIGASIEDVDVIELNEAFASQAIACVRDLEVDPARVNADGGAIALGHPLGCSGARLVLSAVRRMEDEEGSTALATLCVGVGQGVAVLLERA